MENCRIPGLGGRAAPCGTEMAMHPNEKSGEPSMEEILASIRKIISDDPPSAATAVMPAGAQPAAAAHAKFANTSNDVGSPVLEAPARRSASPSLEQELAELLREPLEIPPAARPAAASVAVPMPPASGAAPANAPSPSSPAAQGGLGSWRRGRPAGPANGAAPPTSPQPSASLSAELPRQAEPANAQAAPPAPAPAEIPAAPRHSLPPADPRHTSASRTSAAGCSPTWWNGINQTRIDGGDGVMLLLNSYGGKRLNHYTSRRSSIDSEGMI